MLKCVKWRFFHLATQFYALCMSLIRVKCNLVKMHFSNHFSNPGSHPHQQQRADVIAIRVCKTIPKMHFN